MKCDEFKELAAAYALDALPEEERLAALHHLRAEGPHEGCEEWVGRFERTADRLGQALAAAPLPAGLWQVIALRLGLNVVGIDRVGASPARWREGLAWAAAAAALIAAVWSHQTTQRTQGYADQMHERSVKASQELATMSAQLGDSENAHKQCTTALERLTSQSQLSRDAVSLLEQASTKVAQFAPAGTQTYGATALYNAQSERAVVISTSLPRVEGKDYELWVIAAGATPQPAGFVRFDSSGVAIGEFSQALLHGVKPSALAVSLEPAGGRPTPTEVVLVAKLAG